MLCDSKEKERRDRSEPRFRRGKGYERHYQEDRMPLQHEKKEGKIILGDIKTVQIPGEDMQLGARRSGGHGKKGFETLSRAKVTKSNAIYIHGCPRKKER